MNTSRFLARALDYSLFFTLLTYFNLSFLAGIILFFSLPILFAPMEGLFYTLFKTTPGKWVFGISLSKKLNFFLAQKLAFKKALLILPLLFPPLNIIFLIFYLRESKEHKHNRWSRFEETEIVNTKRNIVKHFFLAASCLFVTLHFTPNFYKATFNNYAHSEFTFDNWVKVKNDDLNFSVFFPKQPTIENKQVEVKEQNTTLNFTEYTHSADVNYLLTSTKVPTTWTLLGSSFFLKSLKKELEKHQGKIISSKMMKHKSYPAMSYLLQNHEGGQAKGLVVLVKKTLYKLEVTGKKDLTEEQLEISQNFISSFDVA